MALNLPGIPFKLSAQDMGNFDLASALRSGFAASEAGTAAKYAPKKYAEELLNQHLQNKINAGKAQYAQEQALADLQGTRARASASEAEASLAPWRQKLLEAQFGLAGANADKAKQLASLYTSLLGNNQNNNADQGTNVAPRVDGSHYDQEGNLVPGKIGGSRADLAAALLHLPVHSQVVNGQLVTRNPLTGISSVKVGPSAAETAESKSNVLTNALKTQNQNIITNVPKVKRLIDAISSAPSPTEFPGYRPSDRAKHESLVKEASETYAKAKGWPNTNESIKAASEILGRGKFESDSAYRVRLKELKNELDRNVEDANNVLHPGQRKNKPSSNIIEYIRDENGRLVPK